MSRGSGFTGTHVLGFGSRVPILIPWELHDIEGHYAHQKQAQYPAPCALLCYNSVERAFTSTAQMNPWVTLSMGTSINDDKTAVCSSGRTLRIIAVKDCQNTASPCKSQVPQI